MKDLAMLWLCTFLTMVLVITELVLGHFSHCLTLLAVTNQTIYNFMTLVFMVLAKMLQRRGGRDLKSTFGWARIEVVGSLGSLIFLGSLSFATSIECLQTLFHNDHLDAMHQSFYICLLAGAHFAVWLVAFMTIGGYSYAQNALFSETSAGSVQLQMPNNKRQQQFKAFSLHDMLQVPFKDVFRDLHGCVFLFIVSTISFVSSMKESFNVPDIKYIDPCMALLTIGILLITSGSLAKNSGLILLQTIPDILDVKELKEDILKTFPGIVDVHEMHIWCLVPGDVTVTMHVIFKDHQGYNDMYSPLMEHMKLNGVTTLTLQPEFLPPQVDKKDDEIMCIEKDCQCLLRCKNGNEFCKSCCPTP